MNLNRWIAPILSRVYSLYSLTYRYTIINDRYFRELPPHRPPIIFAHWHSDDLSMIGPHRNKGHTILVSQSRDGDLLAHALEYLGYRTIRGSSTRGGVRGLLQLIQTVRNGADTVVTVDGPTGPRGIVKPGIIMLSYKTGAPIQTLGAQASRKIVFRKSWSQTFIPAPFSKVQILYSPELIAPPASDSESDLEACRLKVERSLNDVHEDLGTM